MSHEPNSDPASGEDRKSRGNGDLTYEEIALRAYFIALQRHRQGEVGDPQHDWAEAQRQIKAERRVEW